MPWNPQEVNYYANATSLNGPYSVTTSGNYLYVASYTGNSLTTFNITNPASPKQTANYTNATSLYYATSVTASGNYLYVASYLGNSLTTFNITNPATPVQVAYYTNATSLNNSRSVTASGNYLYVASYTGKSLTTFNITNPATPVQVAYYNNTVSLNGPYSVTASGNYLYVASVTGNSLTTFNITSPATPVQVAYYTNATSLNGAQSVTTSGNYLYVASGSGNSLTTFNITSPATPVQTAYYTNATSLYVSDSVTTSGNYLYVVSWFGNSLTTFNITNPATPVQVAYYTNATSLNNPRSVTTSGNYLYVASASGNSLTTFDITPLPVPTISFVSPTPVNGTITSNTSVQINVSLTEQNLNSFKFNWNGTNYSYYDDSLVLSLNLDNNSAIGESATKAVDISKYGNNGTLMNGTTAWNPSGRYRGGVALNGSTYIAIPDSAQNRFGTGDFTISLWMNTTDSTNQVLVGKYNGNGSDYYYISKSTGVAHAAHFYLSGAAITSGSVAVDDGKWHHLVCMRSSGTIYLYVDGVKVANATGPGMASSSGALMLGKLGAGATFFYNGSLDEVMIWNRSLSAAEITQQYQSNLRKSSSSQWYFEANNSNLSSGSYTYYAWANNSAGMANQTETRSISTGIIPPPQISFVSPTPQNGTSTPNTSVQINVSITEPSLNSFKFNWNGTNYSIYDDSLVLALNLDNNSAIGESSSKAVDISRYGNNGTINGATWDAAGKWGGGANFNGVTNYISLGIYISAGSSGTMVSWIKPSGTYGGSQIIMGSAASNGADASIRHDIVATGHCANGEWSIFLPGSGMSQIACSGQSYNSANFPAGIWTQVAITYDGSQVKFYKDGLLINTVAQTATGAGNAQPFSIGRFGAYPGGYYNGSIDEVRIWSRSLSADEIKQHYQSNLQKFNSSQWYFQSNQLNLSSGDYTYFAWANNSAGLANQTETRFISTGGAVLDTTPPESVLSSPPSGNKTSNTSVNFTCNAIDGGGLSNITLKIWDSSNSSVYSNTTPLSGTSNSTSWAYTFASRGNYSWNCLAYDNSSNSASATTNASLTIQKYAKLQIIAPQDGSSLPRGKNGPEDIIPLNKVADNMSILAQITENESGIPISGVQCGLSIDSSPKGASTTNSSGHCVFSYDRSVASLGAHQVSLNISSLSQDYVASSPDYNSTFNLDNWTMKVDINNYRSGLGAFYYNGDLALVNVTVARNGNPANVTGIWFVMTDGSDNPLAELGISNFTQASTGVYQTEIIIPSGTSWVRWKAVASSDFPGQDSNASSNQHTDVEVYAAPTANLNVSMVGQGNQPLADSSISIYRVGKLGKYPILNQAIGSGTQSVQKALIQNDSGYDLEISAPDGSMMSIMNFNLSAGLKFMSQQANFTDQMPNQTRLMSAVLASNATSFEVSTLTFAKTFEPDKICSCQNWSYANSNCSGAWQCNSTSDYEYSSNSTHAWFNVTHFTGYAIGQSENENLTIWDETDSGMPYGNQMKYISQNIRFFANYSNSTSEPITGADCSIWFLDSGWNAMEYNSTNLYEYTRVFTSGGSFDWNVSCNKSGQATLDANDSVIVNSTIAVVLNSPTDSAIVKSSIILYNWSVYGFPADPTCNLTRNGSVVYSATCTNNALCGYTNSTANGYYVWNVTCNSGATTRTSSTRTLTVNTLYHSTNVEGVLNMNITEISSISLPQNTISFGTVEITQTYDSYPGQFFVIKNDGNTIVDIEVNATNPFLSSNCTSLPCSAYQVKVGANETIPYPICSGNPSKESYTNMFGSSSGLLINNFNFVDNDDSANVYIKFRLPNDEPPGSKSSTVTFWAKSAGSYACD